jgi:hypothetical protein
MGSLDEVARGKPWSLEDDADEKNHSRGGKKIITSVCRAHPVERVALSFYWLKRK